MTPPFLKKILKWISSSPLCAIFLILSGWTYLVYKATLVALPTVYSPVTLYASHCRQDLKLLYCEALQKARRGIFASFYGISDVDIISLIALKAKQGQEVTIEYDKKASAPLTHVFPPNVCLIAKKSKGLMHQKILVVDQSLVFLGSANWTLPSLRHHTNLVMGFHSPTFATYLTQFSTSLKSPFFSSSIENQQLSCWLLPYHQSEALNHLLSLIASAKKTIRIAMFTFTHPKIVQALKEALAKNIQVHLISDYYAGQGASKKALEMLLKAGGQVSLSTGQQLLHHKWAIIDDLILVMGSANWTKAAFTKNEDFLLSLSPLNKGQKKFLNSLWQTLLCESEFKTPEESQILN